MSSRTDTPTRIVRIGNIHRYLIPVGVGWLTWLLLVLLLGTLVATDISGFSLVLLFLYGMLLLPIYRLRPWEPRMTGRLTRLLAAKKVVVILAIVLLIVLRLPSVTDRLGILQAVLQFPLQLVPVAFQGAAVFYATRGPDLLGELLFAGGRLYVEFLWAYVIALGLHGVVAKLAGYTSNRSSEGA